MAPAPAYVANAPGDVLAWTSTYEALMRPLGALDGEPPNLARYTLLDPRARAAYPDWGAVADWCVADLRATNRPGEPIAEALVEELAAAGQAFTSRWDAQPARPARSGRRRVP